MSVNISLNIRCGSVTLFILLASFGLNLHANAEPSPSYKSLFEHIDTVDLFTTLRLPKKALRPKYLEKEVIRRSPLNINLNRLSISTLALRLHIGVNSVGVETQLLVKKNLVYETESGVLVWQGKVVNQGESGNLGENSVILVRTSEGITGTIRYNVLLLKLSKGADGYHWLNVVDQNQLPDEHAPGEANSMPEGKLHAKIKRLQGRRDVKKVVQTAVIRVWSVTPRRLCCKILIYKDCSN